MLQVVILMTTIASMHSVFMGVKNPENINFQTPRVCNYDHAAMSLQVALY